VAQEDVAQDAASNKQSRNGLGLCGTVAEFPPLLRGPGLRPTKALVCSVVGTRQNDKDQSSEVGGIGLKVDQWCIILYVRLGK
jgi:hypothetical protein